MGNRNVPVVYRRSTLNNDAGFNRPGPIVIVQCGKTKYFSVFDDSHEIFGYPY